MHKVTILMSDAELDAARALADANGVSVSDFLRGYVRDSYTQHSERVRIRTDLLWLLKRREAQTTVTLMQSFAGRYEPDPLLGAKIARVLHDLQMEGYANGSPAQGYTLTDRGNEHRKAIERGAQ